jgi:hypothetical protein
MIDDISRAVELASKKMRVLVDHSIEHVLTQIGYC